MTYIDFEQHIPATILQRGKAYYNNGAIQDIETTTDGYFAVVNGTETYEVELTGKQQLEDWYCDCPYDGITCKHVAAVLYSIQARQGSFITTKKNQVNEIFKKVPNEELLAFFKNKLVKHKKLKQELLLEFFMALDPEDNKRFDTIFENIYKNTPTNRDGYIGYRETQQLAHSVKEYLYQVKKALAKGFYDEALAILKPPLYKLSGWLLEVDDSSGELQGAHWDMVDYLKELLEKDITIKFKTEIIDLSLDAVIKDPTDFDTKDNLLRALLQQELNTEQLIKIKTSVEYLHKNLSGEYTKYEQENYLKIQIDLNERLGETSANIRLIEENLHLPGIRTIKLKILLEQEDYEAAKLLIQKGIQIANTNGHLGTVNQWEKDLVKVYRLEGNPNAEKQILKDRLSKDFSIKDYKAYKVIFTKEEQPKIVTEVIALLEKKKTEHYYRASDLMAVYKEEKMWEALMTFLKESNAGYYTLKRFHKDLSPLFPDELLQLYKQDIEAFSKETNKRSDYRQLADKIERLITIKGGTAVAKILIADYNIRFKKRPAMIEELSKIKL